MNGSTSRVVAAAAVLSSLAALAPATHAAQIAFYGFEGNLNDAAGAHHGTAQNGASIVPTAKVGTGALQLDGVDDFVSLIANDGSTNFQSLGSGFSVAAWVNPSAVGGTRRVFGADRSTGASGFGFGIINDDVQLTTFGVKDYNSVSTVPTNTWTHIAAVLDSAFDTTFYVNGVSVGTILHTAGANVGSNPFVIGRTTVASQPTPTELFAGLVDEVRVFNHQLTAAEVAALAQVPEPAALGLAAVAATTCLARRRHARAAR